MEKIKHEFDPTTGIATVAGFVDDKLVTRQTQDVSASVEYATALRNDDDYSKQGIKRGFMHAMHIPAIDQIELMKIGIDIFTAKPRDIAAGLRRLGKDHLITTRKKF